MLHRPPFLLLIASFLITTTLCRAMNSPSQEIKDGEMLELEISQKKQAVIDLYIECEIKDEERQRLTDHLNESLLDLHENHLLIQPENIAAIIKYALPRNCAPDAHEQPLENPYILSFLSTLTPEVVAPHKRALLVELFILNTIYHLLQNHLQQDPYGDNDHDDEYDYDALEVYMFLRLLLHSK